jgi:BirA family biotin operon repressor/biotin-[acetyl-CoA-carboxylase] ligase
MEPEGRGTLRTHLHFAEVPSTMETARQEIQRAPDTDFLLVTAETQTQGRGTRGRPWHSPLGNVYLTLAVHRRLLPPERLKLFPLEAGLSLWEAVLPHLSPAARSGLKLKWPNDLLWEGRKAAGMLIEAAGDHVFAGVGVNIVAAPPIADGGTPSAALAEAGASDDCGLPVAKDFFAALRARLLRPASPEDVAALWKACALWNKPLRLRDRPGRPEVTPVDLNGDGHLRVRFADGREEWLISDYLA